MPAILNIPNWSQQAKQQYRQNYLNQNPRNWTEERWALLGQNCGVNQVQAATDFARMANWQFGSVNTLASSWGINANGHTGAQWVTIGGILGPQPPTAPATFCRIQNWSFAAVQALATAYAAERHGLTHVQWANLATTLPNDDVDGVVAVASMPNWNPAPRQAIATAWSNAVNPLLTPAEWAELSGVATVVPANDSGRGTTLCTRGAWVDSANNDAVAWDWPVWETQGNADPKYRRGGETRELGLYRIDYGQARRAGNNNWAQAWQAANELGGGWVKVVIIPGYDYRPHANLISALLPSFVLNQQNGSLAEPNPGNNLYIVFPYNFDDNKRNSRALGTRLRNAALTHVSARRLAGTLPRWATASRSTIVEFAANAVNTGNTYAYQQNEEDWPYREYAPNNNVVDKIAGPNNQQTLRATQANQNAAVPTYSVKTGVQYVASVDQSMNDKDLLESNSIHAMLRSELIHKTQDWVTNAHGGYAWRARYQIEILSMLLNTGQWDGIQVREIGAAGRQESWFPALSIPNHGKPFAAAWGQQAGNQWFNFWSTNFAEPLGRAKAEMLCMFGMQHMTANAQNMLCAFTAAAANQGGAFQALLLRDLGDTLLNNEFFAVLQQVPNNPGQYYTQTFQYESNSPHGVTLTHGNIGGGYVNPLMTRLGTSIVFFFGPFLKGDIETGRAPEVTAWGIALNNAFRAYFVNEVGYTNQWEVNGPNNLQPNALNQLEQRILQYGGYSGANAVQYGQLVPDVLGLSSADRQTLLTRFENAAGNVQANQYAQGKALVDAHDMVMGAEMQVYIGSNGGTQAMLALH